MVHFIVYIVIRVVFEPASENQYVSETKAITTIHTATISIKKNTQVAASIFFNCVIFVWF